MRMEPPHARPVGTLTSGDAYGTAVRQHSPVVRLSAAVVLVTFAAVTVATTAYSLGAYCLTSGNGPITLLRF